MWYQHKSSINNICLLPVYSSKVFNLQTKNYKFCKTILNMFIGNGLTDRENRSIMGMM